MQILAGFADSLCNICSFFLEEKFMVFLKLKAFYFLAMQFWTVIQTIPKVKRTEKKYQPLASLCLQWRTVWPQWNAKFCCLDNSFLQFDFFASIFKVLLWIDPYWLWGAVCEKEKRLRLSKHCSALTKTSRLFLSQVQNIAS